MAKDIHSNMNWQCTLIAKPVVMMNWVKKNEKLNALEEAYNRCGNIPILEKEKFNSTNEEIESEVPQIVNLGPNRLLHWRQISVKTLTEVLHLAGALMEHFLEVSAPL